jgi:hypothetical protein
MAAVMAVIPKTYDLLVWLLPTLAKFPRDQKTLQARAGRSAW